MEKFFAVGMRFGFQTEVGTTVDDIEIPPGITMPHLILLAGHRSPDATADLAMPFINKGWSASLAIDYVDETRMLAARAQVESLKYAIGDQLNFLRPDSIDQTCVFVSDEKILDNAVCDTVRVKYHPVRRGDSLINDEEFNIAWRDFAWLSELYARHSMYLRSSTDGYIARRSQNGFLITCTKTDKVRLRATRLSEVLGYDKLKNLLEYRGGYLPSSDAVEAHAIFKSMPEISVVFHTHASDLFTRNPIFADRVLVPRLPYGEPELGDALVGALRTVGDGFIIMEEHGEVFAGPSLEYVNHRVEEAVSASRSRSRVGVLSAG
ncbi:MAG: class II aldolase/adducin family protein [Nitrobacter sp.]|nr:class II aldolase/adducin family protein [Nitrobacter sp.]